MKFTINALVGQLQELLEEFNVDPIGQAQAVSTTCPLVGQIQALLVNVEPVAQAQELFMKIILGVLQMQTLLIIVAPLGHVQI